MKYPKCMASSILLMGLFSLGLIANGCSKSRAYDAHGPIKIRGIVAFKYSAGSQMPSEPARFRGFLILLPGYRLAAMPHGISQSDFSKVALGSCIRIRGMVSVFSRKKLHDVIRKTTAKISRGASLSQEELEASHRAASFLGADAVRVRAAAQAEKKATYGKDAIEIIHVNSWRVCP